MSKKCNVRSFRYSDEVAAILEGMPGKSMNDNFEQLILECYYKLPELEKKRKSYENEISRQQMLLRKLQYEIEPALKGILRNADLLVNQSSSLADAIERVTQSPGGCVDQASKDV